MESTLTRSAKLREIPFVFRNPAVSAMKRMSAMAAENGISDMTLEEINAEIEEVRKG